MNRTQHKGFGYLFITYAVVILVSLLFFSPFVYLLSTALKDEVQLLMQPRVFFPLPMHFENFVKVFQQYDIVRYFSNTITVAIFSILGNLIVSTLAGYALSRIEYRGREVIFILTLSCMFIPLFLIIIPRFLIFKKLGMIGTLLPLIIPSAFGSPFSIFLMRQFLRGIPMDLSEAARIDGCSEFGIYGRIIMPLCKPVIATIIIFTAQWRWNDFIEPLIYLQNEKLYTITMGLYTVLGLSAEDITTNLVMTFVILSILPIIIIFVFAQKLFIEGVAHTGLKG
ncbi:MAG: carbohydrate ABC transporter permease [Spirochaetes bacterium]|nr:carbohydrate ABC transporter permease [Spirochaetota bacterium]